MAQLGYCLRPSFAISWLDFYPTLMMIGCDVVVQPTNQIPAELTVYSQAEFKPSLYETRSASQLAGYDLFEEQYVCMITDVKLTRPFVLK